MLRRVQKWLWDARGLTCREATRLAARAMDQPLTISERVRLLVHSLLCGYCRNYARQLALLRKWARRLSAPNAPSLEPGMPAVSASRIKKRLASETSRTE
jgi:hypothetical protein